MTLFCQDASDEDGSRICAGRDNPRRTSLGGAEPTTSQRLGLLPIVDAKTASRQIFPYHPNELAVRL
jgi:hypothetical protein